MIKGSIQHQAIPFVNIYAPNTGETKYMKPILTGLKGDIASNTVVGRDYNNPLSSMDASFRQKINTETSALKDTLDQMDLIDTEHFTEKQNTNSTQAHTQRSPGLIMLDHKTSCYTFKKTKI